MVKKGRYGQFIRGVFTFVDFLILNLTYLTLYLLCSQPDDFFTRQVWFMMNIAMGVCSYVYSSIHSTRIMFADQVILSAIKSVVLHAVLFFAMLLFLNLENIHVRTYLEFYLIFMPTLCIW